MHLTTTTLTLLAVASSLVAGLPTQQEQQQLTFNAPAALSSHIEPIQLTDDRLRRLLDEHIASLPERRLVRLSEDGPALAISEGEKALLTLQGKKFVDVTDEEELFIAQAKGESSVSRKVAGRAGRAAVELQALELTGTSSLTMWVPPECRAFPREVELQGQGPGPPLRRH